MPLARLSAGLWSYTTIYNRFNRWSKQGIWEAIFYKLTGSSGVVSSAAIDTTHIKARRCRRRKKGGRTSKIHTLTDVHSGPRAFVVTAGNTHDLVGTAAPDGNPATADFRAYDASKLRQWFIERGCEPMIPPVRPVNTLRLTTSQPTRPVILSSARYARSKTSAELRRVMKSASDRTKALSVIVTTGESHSQ